MCSNTNSSTCTLDISMELLMGAIFQTTFMSVSFFAATCKILDTEQYFQ